MTDFPNLTKRLEYYLKPTDELLKNEEYLALNTRFSINTAMHAIKILALMDPVSKHSASRMKDGVIMLKVLPDGPAAQLIISHGEFKVLKGEIEKPTAVILFKDLKIANDMINGKIDAFSAAASGDVLIKGQLPLIDALNLILDRVPLYIS
ncbi:MAG: hypothetical protein HQK78_11405 [Desulfobacterales bacterium]|nr:hypothetical protein [Desulfobacterales bacterium]